MTHRKFQQNHPKPAGFQELSTALTEKAKAGDKAAFEQLVSLFHQEIFRMVYSRTRSQMDAEDLTQDIFFQAFTHLATLKEPDRFRPWIFTIAVNRVRDFNRKKRFLSFFGLSSPSEGGVMPEPSEVSSHSDIEALDELLRVELWNSIRQLSEKLSSMEREVFFLRFIDDLNIREIAEVLKKSESAIKTHLYRALKKFKEDSTLMESLRGDQ